ncbi:hypothetical protein PI172_1083 [Prevotella intermedia]|uniref:Uncharacterized protein n=1 Tax=Prevotella intermedia TaxID=28131 RepID=A0AAD1F7C0_PREIN|nr:hypothetical protein PI172_1083 [Prevotella intermedia]
MSVLVFLTFLLLGSYTIIISFMGIEFTFFCSMQMLEIVLTL